MLLVLAALLLLLLAMLLLLPLQLHLRLDSDLQAPDWEEELTGKVRWLVRLRWGWGVLTGEWEGEGFALVRAERRILGIKVRSGSRQKPATKKVRKKQRPKFRPDLKLLWALVSEFFHVHSRLRKRYGFPFTGALTYGFSDPSLTGWCEALRWSTGLPIPIHLEPDFQRPILMGHAETGGSALGYQLIGTALPALRNPEIRTRLDKRIRFRPLRWLLLRGG